MIAALIPLFWMRDSYEGFSWGYRETFGRLLDRAHRRLVGGAVSDGIQGAALLLIWPLAIFLIIGGSYELLGLLLTLTLLILLIVRDGMDGIIRRLRVLRSLPVRIAIVSSAWVGRILVFNPVSIIFSDAYLHAGNPKISTDHGTFEQTSDAGHFIDEYTVLREIGLLIGRILLCIAFVLTANAFSLYVAFGTAFVIAGIAAGLSVIAGAARDPRSNYFNSKGRERDYAALPSSSLASGSIGKISSLVLFRRACSRSAARSDQNSSAAASLSDNICAAFAFSSVCRLRVSAAFSCIFFNALRSPTSLACITCAGG
jgi:hypothetical protein